MHKNKHNPLRTSFKTNVMSSKRHNYNDCKLWNIKVLFSLVCAHRSHQGSMLWSQFSAIFDNFRRFSTIFGDFRQFSATFDNFRRKNWCFSQQPMLWSFFSKLAFVLSKKNANFFAKFFGENILKIITSVPGHSCSIFSAGEPLKITQA
jgi:hypothetical protein